MGGTRGGGVVVEGIYMYIYIYKYIYIYIYIYKMISNDVLMI